MVNNDKISKEELFKRRKELSGKANRSSGFLNFNWDYSFRLGRNQFINVNNVINHNRENLISFKNENNNLFISMRLYDKKEL